jgi:SAM-dependent methyltransferase
MAGHTYEQSVQWLRSRPEHAELVRLSYLDEDTLAAARRFTSSEEFAEVSRLLRLGSPPARRVLDVGCGNGIASFAFAALGYDVDAVDPDPSDDVGAGAARRLAAHATAGSLRVTIARVEELPFADRTFDVAYTRQAVHHFDDLASGLRECARVLRPGGVLLATREHIVDDDAQLAAFLRDHPLHHLHGGENAYPLERYLAELDAAGFVSVRALGPYDTVINHFPESNADVRASLELSLRGKLGPLGFAGPWAARIGPVERRFRRSASALCAAPGRMYSFLATSRR